MFYVSIVCFSLLVAGYFLLMGVWMIIIFTSIEILALTIALYVYTRHALDYEKITIEGKRLLFERSWGGKLQQHEFNTVWTKVVATGKADRDIALKSANHEVVIGFFVGVNEREKFQKELQQHLGI